MIILKKKHKNSIINIIKGTSTENENDCQLTELNKTINNNGNYTYTPIGDIIGYNKVNINVDVPQETFDTETKDITITENGTTTVVPSSGYDGMTEVNITTDVPIPTFETEELNKTITENGTYTYTPSENVDGYNKVNINIDVPIPTFETETKNITITENGTTTVVPSSGYDGLESVNITVDVPQQEPIELQSKNVTITENGTTTVVPSSGYDGMTEVSITTDVPIPTFTTETKDITITENGTTTVTPSSGYDGMTEVSITTDVKPNLFSFEEELTKNGEYSYSVNFPNSPYDGFGNFKIDVNVQPTLQELNYNVNRNGEYDIIPTDGFNAIGNVKLNVDVPIPTFTTETKDITITKNGTTTVVPSTGYDGITEVSITTDVPIPTFTTEELNKTITENGTYTYTSSVNVDGYNKVNINVDVPTSEYDFSGLGYTSNDTSIIDQNILDGIAYGEKIKQEYTDDKRYQGDTNLVYFPMVNTSSRSNFSGMFLDCLNLQYVPPLIIDVESIDLNAMFMGCSALRNIDVSNYNFEEIYRLSGMFYCCFALEEIIGLDKWNVSGNCHPDNMFNFCKNLKSLNLSTWDFGGITDYVNTIFDGCTSLTNLHPPRNINISIGLRSCTNLTVDSLLSVLNNLVDRTNTSALPLYLGATNIAKLTDEQKAIATNKNWILED